MNKSLCIKVDFPEDICKIDDECKAIYHSKDSVCIWVFNNRDERNRFVDESIGMNKEQRSQHYQLHFSDTD